MQGTNFLGESGLPVPHKPVGVLIQHKALLVVALLAVAGLVGSWWWVNSTVPVSSFELKANGGDALGVPPDTTFTLTSSHDLSAETVRENIITRPAVDFDIQRTGNGTYELTPVGTLPENRVLAIAVDGDAADRAYSWAFTVKAPMAVVSAIPGHQSTGVPLNSGIELTFNRPNVTQPEKYISIEPSVDVKVQTDGEKVTLIPQAPLKKSTVYTVRVRAGLGASDTDDVLAKEVSLKFETASDTPAPQYSTYFSFDRSFWDFPNDRQPVFGVQAGQNTTSVVSSVYRFTDADDFLAWYGKVARPEWGWSQYNRISTEPLPVSQRVWEGSVPVERGEGSAYVSIPQQLAQGFYVASALPAGETQPVLAWFQVTPVVNYLAVSGDRTLVALRSATSGDPVPNASILFGGSQIGSTGQDGVALFKTPEALIAKPDGDTIVWGAADNFLTVRTGSTTLIIPIESQYGWYWRITPPEKFWSYVSEDKTIYQPDDTVRFWGVVKQRNDQDMRGKRVTVQIEDGYWFEGAIGPSSSTVYAQTSAVISDFYTLTGSIPLAGLEPRTYQMVVRLDNEVVISDTITVQAYVKPAYKLELEPETVTMYAGNPLSFKVRASFFDGTPVDRLALKYDGWSGSGEQQAGTVTLDERGEGSFTVQVPYKDQEWWPNYLTMRVTPQNPEEGEISATAWVNVFGPSLYLDVNQTDQSKGASQRFDLKLRAIDLEAAKQGQWFDPDRDAPVKNKAIEATVTEITYHRDPAGTGYDPISKTTYPLYTYWDERVDVAVQTLTTGGDGDAQFQYDLKEDKGYEFRFTSMDERGRRETEKRYAWRTTWAWSVANGQSGVMLRGPADPGATYAIGDAITAQMYDLGGNELPSRAGAYLFLRMTNGLRTYAVQDSPVFRDAFNDADVPNAQILGVYFDGQRFLDTMPVNYQFDAEQMRLRVEAKPNQERYKPGQQATLDIRVTDRDGSPVSAEVNVSALDEAVFTLNPDARDFVTNLYRGIYTPVLTRSSHKEPLNAAGAERGGCFLGGTRVRTPDGERKIEDIRDGDVVLAIGDDGTLVPQHVSRPWSRMYKGYLVINERLQLTENHILWVNGGWMEAGRLRIGDTLSDEKGHDVPVVSIRAVDDRVRVYNFEVQPTHAYIAEGIRVHNEEKGGAEVRTDFRDQALYTSVTTGSDGRATVQFALPDNITSWRITSQAVTKNLQAGTQVTMVPVGLPFFVDATMNRTYLAGDNPVLRMRTFGAQVPERALYRVDAPTLPVGSKEIEGGRQTEVEIGALPAGVHDMTVSAQGGELKDALKKTFMVVQSYFARQAAGFYELRPDLTNIAGTADGYTSLTFMSLERGKLYSALTGMSWGGGSRLDSVLAMRGAQLLLRDTYGEKDAMVSDINGSAWQRSSDGGMALLPYGGDDLELSAKVADIGPALGVGIATDRLRAYFESSLTDEKQDIHRRAIALYGLSALHEPYLGAVRQMAAREDLTTSDALYVALALDRIGAKEEARGLWNRVINPQIQHSDGQVFLKGASDEASATQTALAAWVAASLQYAESDALMAYVEKYPPVKTLVDIERYGWARDSLPHLKPGPVSFTYTVEGASATKSLNKDERFSLTLNAAQLASLTFSAINGRVGMTSSYTAAADPAGIRRSSSVGISRRYVVGNASTTTFREGDVVRVELTPNYSAAPAGAYEITDYLPSGLRAIAGPPSGGYAYDECVPWILASSGQRVSLFSYNSSIASYNRCRTVSYYARVVSKGSYRAEPALIQMSGEPDRQNISASATVNIQ